MGFVRWMGGRDRVFESTHALGKIDLVEGGVVLARDTAGSLGHDAGAEEVNHPLGFVVL